MGDAEVVPIQTIPKALSNPRWQKNSTNPAIKKSHRSESSSRRSSQEMKTHVAKNSMSGSEHGVADTTSVFKGAWLDPSGMGIAVPVVRGSCVVFFARSAASGGMIDPWSWHGGAAVCNASAGSWLARLHTPP